MTRRQSPKSTKPHCFHFDQAEPRRRGIFAMDALSPSKELPGETRFRSNLTLPSHQLSLHAFTKVVCTRRISRTTHVLTRRFLGSADFFPWTGHRPEDVLTEQTTKSGFYDKLQVSHNESTTARPSVWSSLKYRSGIPVLSQLFVSALDQRQIHGTITANATFKPPPRVTLTDTKREAWLRALANPSIPLRRLSRTIPHGIRGKILLDHCLSKDIPTSRAIWLAKCVGANEIRAFKRKGTGGVFTVGGEAKWIKDWTINVEQFLESIISICGSIEWRAKINYGYVLLHHTVRAID